MFPVTIKLILEHTEKYFRETGWYIDLRLRGMSWYIFPKPNHCYETYYIIKFDTEKCVFPKLFPQHSFAHTLRIISNFRYNTWNTLENWVRIHKTGVYCERCVYHCFWNYISFWCEWVRTLLTHIMMVPNICDNLQSQMNKKIVVSLLAFYRRRTNKTGDDIVYTMCVLSHIYP